MAKKPSPRGDRPSSRNWIEQPGLPEVVRTIRQQRKLTQKALADLAGLSPAAVARLESGDRRPSPATLEAIAGALQVSDDDLLEAAEQMAADPAAGARATARIATEQPADYGPPNRRTLDPTPTTQSELGGLIAELGESGTRHLLDHLTRWAVQVGDQAPALARRLLEELGTNPAPLERVASMPSGTVRSVFANALARDQHGTLWIDPNATVRPGGMPGTDPRVERFADGRIRVDLTRLSEDVTPGARDPDRHCTRASEVDPSERDELAAVYAATIIEIRLEDDTTLAIPGDAGGPFELPNGAEVVHVLTAANPRSRLLTDAENIERNAMLARQLDAANIRYVPAVVRATDGSWAEQSFALLDADHDQVDELARLHEQNAVFVIATSGTELRWMPSHKGRPDGHQCS